MKNIILVILLFYTSVCCAQTRSESFFEKGSKVCFVGNSITHAGEFHHNILLYHITRFPGQPVRFFNCGISGDVTGGVLERMEDDILVHKPTHAVIMLGMNDVSRSLYQSKPTANADTLRLREAAINTYKANLEKIVNIFLSKNIRVILQKPSIYDQTARVPALNNFGVNDALKTCADFIGELAKKYKLPTVDYWTIMTQINREMQKKDSLFTITGPDRVHPASAGHLVMAYQFLKSEGAPRYVSKIVVDKTTKKSSGKSLNCEIKSITRRKNGVSFVARENALPFPFSANQQKGLELVPFVNDLNVELLQVHDLNPGQYQLAIDDSIIGIFSEAQFSKGINMAEYTNTPQCRQSAQIREMLSELWKMETVLRNIKLVEYNRYFKESPYKENLSLLKTHLDSVFTVKYKIPSLKSRLEKYITDKPRQKEYEKASEELMQKAFRLATPLDHVFEITLKLNAN